jgi:hypothetical protein
MTSGTRSPRFTAQTSLNISPSFGLGSFSALVNAFITSDLVLANNAVSSASVHQDFEARYALNREIGLSGKLSYISKSE